MAIDFSKLLGSASPLGAASALAGVGYGIFQSIRAKQIEKQNVMPLASVNTNLLQNVGLAEQRSRTGLPSQVYNNNLMQLNQGLTSGLRQAGRMGGTSSIASILRGYGSGIGNLNAQDAQAQRQAEGNLMNQRQTLANEQLRVFNWNKTNPYLRTAQQVASMRSAGTQNIFGGISLLSAQTADAGGTSTTQSSAPQPFSLPNYQNRILGNISYQNGQFNKGY